MKMKKQFLGILLSLVMVLGLMPGMSMTAQAATAYTSGQIRISDMANGDIIRGTCTIYQNPNRALEIYDTDGTTLLQQYNNGSSRTLSALGYDTIVTKTGVGSGDYNNRLVKLQKLSPSPTVTSVTLDKNELSLDAGGATAELIATVEANYDAIKGVTWSSSDSTVATVNSNGVITPVGAGDPVTIKATSTWDNTKYAECVVTVTVGKADPTAPTGLTATYGQTLADVTLPDGWTWVDSAQSVGNVVDPAATFKANFTGNDNYNAASNVDVTVTVGKANAVAATVTANNRTYDGTEKPLVTVTGEATGGEMQYALGTATEATQPYTTSIPAKTDAGTYYIWYKVVGDENHFDSDPKCIVVTIEKPVYSNYEGDGGKWTKGSTDGLKFTFKRSAEDVTTIEHFAGILVDGKEVAESNYDAVSGSVVITLKAPYLETLSAGEHILTAKFNDGDSADAGFTIIEVPAADDNNDSKSGGTADSNESKKTDVKNHKTGDGVPIGLIMIIGLASLVGAVWSLVFKKNLKPTKK